MTASIVHEHRDLPEIALAGARPPGELDVALRRHGSVLVVRLAGPLDVYTAPALREEMRGPGAEAGRIVVDLTEVTILDSAGLTLLLSLRNRAVRDGSTRLALIVPRRRLRRVFAISGLRDAFTFGPDLPSILDAWAA